MIPSIIKKIIRKTTSTGLQKAFNSLDQEFETQKKHRLSLKKARVYKNRSDLKLHLGCGPNLKKEWINIDLNEPLADLALDLRETLPFEDNSCLIIYSQHFLEHVDYPKEVDRLLKECWRILKPGGTFNVGVPDTKWPLFEYSKIESKGYFDLMKSSEAHPAWCSTDLEHINFHFRQDGEHLFAYDEETLRHALSRNGFVSIKKRLFDPSLDTENRKIGTLYMCGSVPT